ncbi:MAG: ribonuclease PH [Candidatus Dadabacteria bacterium]|nr:ribonuclease PH [Candidatus Dadabacteria bacterium]
MSRHDGREPDELRPVHITRGVMRNAEGSALIRVGNTEVNCTATIEESVPAFMMDTGKGWLTAEYAMLPRATQERTRRDSVAGRVSGRSQEIQRIISRVLRASLNMDKLGERMIIVDCDVLQADGGTRTASITGGFVAVYDAVQYMLREGMINEDPISEFVAAVSVGIHDGVALLDLDYKEDSKAGVDLNIAMNSAGEYIEIQGTAENEPFSKDRLCNLLKLAEDGILKLIAKQKEILWE